MWRRAKSASIFLFVAVLLGLATSIYPRFELPRFFGATDTLFNGNRGAVVSAGDICSRTGTSIIQRGGNAVDAAIATDFCLSVTHPFIAGLGGGGYAIVRDSLGNFECVDFRESAPAGSDRDMFKNSPNASTEGGLASGVPGELRGLEYLHKRYGQLS
jgi:gamma-glutamyltranspeptidase/glutathione hydrolase